MKQCKRLVSLVLALTLVLGFVPSGLADILPGYTVEAAETVEIKSAEELVAFLADSGNLGNNAKLTADIEIEYLPVMQGRYTGTFDGNGHTITLTGNENNIVLTKPCLLYTSCGSDAVRCGHRLRVDAQHRVGRKARDARAGRGVQSERRAAQKRPRRHGVHGAGNRVVDAAHKVERVRINRVGTPEPQQGKALFRGELREQEPASRSLFAAHGGGRRASRLQRRQTVEKTAECLKLRCGVVDRPRFADFQPRVRSETRGALEQEIHRRRMQASAVRAGREER